MDFMDIAKGAEKAVPKLADVAKDSMDWVTQTNRRTKAHDTHYSKLNEIKNDLGYAENDYFDDTDPTGEYWSSLRNDYIDELAKMRDNLNLPKTIKKELDDEFDSLQYAIPGENTVDFDIHQQLNDYHKEIAKLSPDEKNLFDTLVEQYNPKSIRKGDSLGPLDFASLHTPHIKNLDPTQRDTYLKLLPDWHGSLEELAVTARML